MPVSPSVCLLTETFFPMVGGGETDTRALARELARLGWPTFVMTRRLSKELPRLDNVDGVPVVRVSPTWGGRFAKYWMFPCAAWELIKRRREYAMVYVVNFRVLGLWAALLMKVLGKPCILRGGTCGELSGRYADASGVPTQSVPAGVSVLLKLRMLFLKQASYFVGISTAIMNEFEMCRVPEGKRRLIACGVDTELFSPVAAPEKTAIRQALNLPTNRYLIGYAGKFNRGKGLEFLIRAIAASVKTFPDMHLVLIGSGDGQFLSEETNLEKLVAELGIAERVTLTGYVQNVQAYLQALDAFCLPTEYEALSIALLEAMSCGLPCIASRVGGVPDLVENGKSGFLIEPAQPELIVQALARLRNEPQMAAQFAQAARLKAARFSLPVIAQQHVDLFRELIQKHRPANGAAHA